MTSLAMDALVLRNDRRPRCRTTTTVRLARAAVSFEQSFERARESVHEFERQIVTGFSLRESVPCALGTKEFRSSC